MLRILVRVMLLATLIGGSFPGQAQMANPTPMEDYPRALECLTLAVAYEAGHESLEGKQAVAEVVLNRVRSPSFESTVCGVVFAGSTRRTGCQFSFTCDGSLRRRLSERVMTAARMVAEDALANRVPARAPGATHYHADYVTPYWASSLTRIAQIGAHIFYHRPGNPAPYGPISLAGAAVPARPPLHIADNRQGPPPSAAVFAPWGLGPDAFAASNP